MIRMFCSDPPLALVSSHAFLMRRSADNFHFRFCCNTIIVDRTDLRSHVFRITRALGWVPANATRDTTFAHLDIKVGHSDFLFCRYAMIYRVCRLTSKSDRLPVLDCITAQIPGELKYPLHVLLVQHGRSCYHCSANGNTTCDSGDVILAKDCPIRGFSSSVANKSAKKGKGEVKPKVKKEESDCEAEEQKPEREDVK